MKPTQRRHSETAKPAKPKSPTTPEDDVTTASIDSFPASDPPGWIDTEAHPLPPEDTASDENPGKKGAKKP
ncbi:MAG: hypothetical protein ABWY00_05815, partial [Dongiaceae bacterium]